MSPDVEADLLQRLGEIPSVRRIASVQNMTEALEGQQPTPGLLLAWDGFTVLENSADGSSSRIDEHWMVVCVVRAVRQTRDAATEARINGLTLAKQVYDRCAGYTPACSIAPLVPVTPPKPLFKEGCFYIPLAFSRRATLVVEP